LVWTTGDRFFPPPPFPFSLFTKKPILCHFSSQFLAISDLLWLWPVPPPILHGFKLFFPISGCFLVSPLVEFNYLWNPDTFLRPHRLFFHRPKWAGPLKPGLFFPPSVCDGFTSHTLVVLFHQSIPLLNIHLPNGAVSLSPPTGDTKLFYTYFLSPPCCSVSFPPSFVFYDSLKVPRFCSVPAPLNLPTV